MLRINIIAAWIAIFIGLLAGVAGGLFFHNESWFGGYGSWRRRLLRLAHVSFFGIAFLNLAFVFSAEYLKVTVSPVSSALFVVAQFAMPAVCYLSAWKEHYRKLFFIPVISAVGSTFLFLLEIFR